MNATVLATAENCKKNIQYHFYYPVGTVLPQSLFLSLLLNFSLSFQFFLLQFFITKIEADWGSSNSNQYHIQTDEGPERFFRYQTDSGQFRNEKRLKDGTVIGKNSCQFQRSDSAKIKSFHFFFRIAIR